jgi:NADH:ubiquinone oxidoreductase subunit 6 (chain J)
MNVLDVLTYIFAFTAILGALTVVMHPNPIYSALGLLLNFFSLAAIYMLLQSPLLSLVQVIVYAGGIVVFFLFVIMLLNLREPQNDRDFGIKGIFSMVFFLLLAIFIISGILTFNVPPLQPSYMSPKVIGRYLLTDGLFAFELSSFVLLVAIIVAIALVKREEEK